MRTWQRRTKKELPYSQSVRQLLFVSSFGRLHQFLQRVHSLVKILTESGMVLQKRLAPLAELGVKLGIHLLHSIWSLTLSFPVCT